MRESAASDDDLAVWIEPAERNMPTSSHRAMIIPVW